MTLSSKRAEYLALTCLIVSLIFSVICLLAGRWSGYIAISGVGWVLLSSVFMWFVLCLQFHQRALSEQEKLDVSQMAGSEKSGTIFHSKNEQALFIDVAQKRQKLFEKWFIPLFAGLIAIYQLGIGFYLLKVVSAGPAVEPRQPLLCAIFMAAIAFVSFLLSRYATGMSAEQQWKPLRAGGSMLLYITIMSFLLAVGLALAQFKIFALMTILAWVIPILLIVIGFETSANLVFDIYRPRLKGQYARSAFDSRLLGVINEPGGIFHTAAGTIDYQFGFKVSQTWFYQLLEKAIMPLVLFGILILYLLSCMVIVAPNEEGIIEHFGNPLSKAGEVRQIGPGLNFKWPWPIDVCYKYPTKKIRELSIGFVPEIDEHSGEVSRAPLLWGQAHHDEEFLLLTASEQSGDKSNTGSVPVSLVVAAVPVHYRIKDLYSFLYNHNEPEKYLESICYRELTGFAASAKVESSGNSHDSLLGAGRLEAGRVLIENIQKAADEAGLGIEIVFLGFKGLHPPVEVAGDYQKAVGSVQKKQAAILKALAERNKILGNLAGSVAEADNLYALVTQYREAKDDEDVAKTEKLAAALDAAFAAAKGDIFATLRSAQSSSIRKSTLAKATGIRFSSQVKAYKAAPEIYMRQQRLAVLEEGLENIRKFVVVANEEDTQVFIVDLQEKLTPDLYDMSILEEKTEK